MPDTNENLTTLYNQLCTSYHRVDDFRAKLLGFLPLASGIAIFGLMDPDKDGVMSQHLREIGFFGVLVTFGLLIYELKGIQKCTGFICHGKLIEEKLFKDPAIIGQFTGLKETDHWSRNIFNEPVTSAFVYATVTAAWVYVSSVTEKPDESKVYVGNLWLSGIIGGAVLIGVIWFWWNYAEPREVKTKMSKSNH